MFVYILLMICFVFLFFFFFSSRRRHTRLVSDWSSDVCSSDLRQVLVLGAQGIADPRTQRRRTSCFATRRGTTRRGRSEERRVGKECRYRWSPYHEKKKKKKKTKEKGCAEYMK